MYLSQKRSYQHAAHLSVHPASPVSPLSPMIPAIWEIGGVRCRHRLHFKKRKTVHLLVLNLVSSSFILQSNSSVIKKAQVLQKNKHGNFLEHWWEPPLQVTSFQTTGHQNAWCCRRGKKVGPELTQGSIWSSSCRPEEDKLIWTWAH